MKRLHEVERDLNLVLMAYEPTSADPGDWVTRLGPGLRLYELSDQQLERLRHLEERFGAVLLAFA
jgi:hypothetical protein